MDTNQPAEELRARQRAHRRRIVELEREAARVHALRSLEYAGLYEVTEQIGRVSGGLNDIELAFKSVQAEAAAELRVSDLTVSRRMHAGLSLAEYPVLIDALEKGDVSQAHASVIISAGDIVEEALRTDYEGLVVEYATKNSVSRTSAYAKRMAERFTETSLEERHEKAMRRRGVFLREEADGMAQLCVVTSAPLAEAMRDRVAKLAHHVATTKSDSDTRTRSNIAADVVTDMLLTADPTAEEVDRVNATVQIIAPAFALLPAEVSDKLRTLPEFRKIAGLQHAEMPGYGPISDEIVRLFAADANEWDRVNIHPVSGEILTVDRYKPSDAQRRLVRARDVHCRFPGCVRPAANTQLDHTLEWANGGRTTTTNLGYLCVRHHTIKHHQIHEWYRWHVTQESDGTLTWTSPTGTSHADEPVSRVMFQPVVQDRGDPDDVPAPF